MILDFGFPFRFEHVDQKTDNLDDTRVTGIGIHHEGSVFEWHQGVRKFQRGGGTESIITELILLLPSLFFALESFIGLSAPRALSIISAGKQKKKAERTRIEVKFAVQIESLPGGSGFANASLLSLHSPIFDSIFAKESCPIPAFSANKVKGRKLVVVGRRVFILRSSTLLTLRHDFFFSFFFR